jgi:hypothetical protein
LAVEIEDASFMGYSAVQSQGDALLMKAVRTADTSVYFDETTRRYIPDSCHLYTRRRENLKSHSVEIV